jgi:hypothetical protein
LTNRQYARNKIRSDEDVYSLEARFPNWGNDSSAEYPDIRLQCSKSFLAPKCHTASIASKGAKPASAKHRTDHDERFS